MMENSTSEEARCRAAVGHRQRGKRPQSLCFRASSLLRSLHTLKDEEGATIVEFAFASMAMLTLLFGLLETCLAVYSYDFTAEAARDGARYMIVRGSKCTSMPDCGADNTNVQSFLRSELFPAVNMNNLTTHTYWYSAATAPPGMDWNSLCATDTPAGCNLQGNAVKVVVSYPFTMNVPFIPPLTINLSNSSQMVISQ
jgi:Flp pilus assembly protein TadG